LRHRHVVTTNSLVEGASEQKPEMNGELVVARPGGRLDFMALSRCLAGGGRALPGRASYVVFDALSAAGTDLRSYPYRVRRAVLERLFDGARPPLAIVPMTTNGAAAQVWLSDHLEAGIEGVVAKRLDHAYSPGKRAWSKVRGRRTAEAVVGGVLGPISGPVALVVGRRDEQGQLRVAGRTSPLPRPARAAVGQVPQARRRNAESPPHRPRPTRLGQARGAVPAAGEQRPLPPQQRTRRAIIRQVKPGEIQDRPGEPGQAHALEHRGGQTGRRDQPRPARRRQHRPIEPRPHRASARLSRPSHRAAFPVDVPYQDATRSTHDPRNSPSTGRGTIANRRGNNAVGQGPDALISDHQLSNTTERDRYHLGRVIRALSV
jgi:hypothetical protein